MSKYDSIIIGSGINSLVVAALLGKQNKKVLVLESREQIGGLSSTIELKKDFKCNAIHDSLKWIDPRLIRHLGPMLEPLIEFVPKEIEWFWVDRSVEPYPKCSWLYTHREEDRFSTSGTTMDEYRPGIRAPVHQRHKTREQECG